MTKLSREKIKNIASDVRFALWNAEEQIVALCQYIDDLQAELDALAKALVSSQRRFELLAAGGVGMVNGADPRVGADEARIALRAAGRDV